MKLDLRNIKVLISRSEETYCYSATLYVDGKAAMTVGNSGQGGCDDYHPVNRKQTYGEVQRNLEAVNKWLKENTLRKNGLDYDLELWCSDMVSQHLYKQDIKRAMRNKIIMVAADGRLMEITMLKNSGVTRQQYIERAMARHPDARFFDNMGENERVEAWKNQNI